ncbi:MAG TPA: ABC-2 family transporter protein [Gaiellaceae bacterium]|nr:ABC-2 family transporter protein [Gaiellaceae bacterium]
MRLDWEIAKRGWRRYAAYPWATAAGIFTNTIFGFIQAYVLLAVFRHRTHVGGLDASDTVTYVWLAQALIMTVYVFGWQELALRIRDGSIVTDLSRPVDPQRYWLSFDIGRAPYHFLSRGVPPFVLGALVFHFHWPSPLDAVLFVPSVALAVVVSFGFRFLYNSASFWLVDFRGVLTMALVLSLFFSGMIMPLQFFPHALGTVARILPFASIMQTPIDVYLGRHNGAALAGLVLEQAAWALVLLALGRLALRAGARKLVVQGG